MAEICNTSAQSVSIANLGDTNSDWPRPERAMNTNDECKCRETNPGEKGSVFFPIRVESAGFPSTDKDNPRKTPTLSPVQLSPGSTTMKLIESGKIKNCIILLKKTSLDQDCLTPLGDDAREDCTGWDDTATELSEGVSWSADSEDGNAPSPNRPYNKHKNKELGAKALNGGGGRYSLNRNIFTSLLSGWADNNVKNNSTVRSSDKECTSYTIAEDGATDANPISDSKVTYQSVSSSCVISQIKSSPRNSDNIDQTSSFTSQYVDVVTCQNTDNQPEINASTVGHLTECRSINRDSNGIQITDCPSGKSDITKRHNDDDQAKIDRNTLCQVSDCQPLSTGNDDDQLIDCPSFKNVTDSNYITDDKSETSFKSTFRVIDSRTVNNDTAAKLVPNFPTKISVDTINEISEFPSEPGISTVDETGDGHSFTSIDAIDKIPEFDLCKGRPSFSNDLMSIPSTGSGETIKYPIYPADNLQERFEIINVDHCCLDEHEIPTSRNTETADTLCDGPPRLERLESLPMPGSCLDQPPILSPPPLMSIDDDVLPEQRNRYGSFSFKASQSGGASPQASFSGDASPVGMAEMTEITEIQSTMSPTRSEPSRRKEDDLSAVSEVFLFRTDSTVSTGVQSQRNNTPSRRSSADSLASEHLQNELPRVSTGAFSFPSSPNEPASRCEETAEEPPRDKVGTPPVEKNPTAEATLHCQDTEYRDEQCQVAETNTHERNTLFPNDIPQRGSAGDLQTSEVISLGDRIWKVGQKLLNDDGRVPDLTPDVIHCTDGMKEKTESIGSCVDRGAFAYNRSVYAGGTHILGNEAASIHSSLSDINSETEIERAVASISETPELTLLNSEQGFPELIFDGSIEVAEVVIDSHAGDSNLSTIGAGVMFSCSRSTDNKNSETDCNDRMSKEAQVNSHGDTSPVCGSDAPNFSVFETNQASHSIQNIDQPASEEATEIPSQLGQTLNSQESRPSSAGDESLKEEECPQLDLESRIEKTLRECQTKTNYLSEYQPKDVSNVSSRSDTSSHVTLEMSPRHNSINENQCSPGRYQEMMKAQDYNRDTCKNTPSSQEEASAASNSNQSRSIDEAVIGRIDADDIACLPSRSQEIDTAISLALMSEMAASMEAKEQNSNQDSPSTNILSSSALPSRNDKTGPRDSRTRHHSASRVSDGHREGTVASAAPQRPNSVHGATIHGAGSSSETPAGNSKPITKGTRGRTAGRYSNGFTIVDCPNPIPHVHQNGQFNELRWRLMQEHGRNLEQPVTTVQTTQPHNLPDFMENSNGRHPHEIMNFGAGIPIEFPNGRRCVAYSREILNCPGTNLHVDQAQGLSESQNQYPKLSRRGSHQLSGAVQTIPSQVPEGVSQNRQQKIQNPLLGLTVNRQRAGSSNTPKNQSLNATPQQIENALPSRCTASTPVVMHSAHEQQLQSAHILPNPSLFSSNSQRVAYRQHQRISIDRIDTSCRAQYREQVHSNNVQPGEGKTVASDTRRIMHSVPVSVQSVSDTSNAAVGDKGTLYITADTSLDSEYSTRPELLNHHALCQSLQSNAAQRRHDIQEGDINNQQIPRISLQPSDNLSHSLETQQRLFINARGSALHPQPQNTGNSRHAVYGATSSLNEQRWRARLSANISSSSERRRLSTTGNLTNAMQSPGPGTGAVPLHQFQANVVASGPNVSACRASPTAVAWREQAVLPANSATAFICNLAEASRRYAVDNSLPVSRTLQGRQTAAEGHDGVASSSTKIDDSHATRGDLRRESNTDAIHRQTAYHQWPAQSEDNLPKTASQVSPQTTTVPDDFLKKLPKDLTNYLINERKKGIPIRETLKAILASLPAEEGKEAVKPRQEERVWRSTIHYRSSDTSPQSNTSSNSTSWVGFHGAPTPYHTQDANAKLPTHPVSAANLLMLPQHSQKSGSRNSVVSETQHQFKQTSQSQSLRTSGTPKRFYNPPPAIIPLLEAPSKSQDTGSIQDQTGMPVIQENNDFVLDLRTNISECVANVCGGDQPLYAEHNSELYHRAYSAGEPGPIRASSLVNLSAIVRAPVIDNLSPTQLLIRSKLLERRSRTKVRSVSTPDILRAYSYPPKRKAKRAEESDNQLGKDLLPPSVHTLPCHERVGQSCEREDRSGFVASLNPAEDYVSSDKGSSQGQTQREHNVQNLTTTDNKEPVSNTLTHYQKVKTSLQNRWVTEAVQPQPQQADNQREKSSGKDQNVLGVESIQEQVCTSGLTVSINDDPVDHTPRFTVSNLSDHGATLLSTSATEATLITSVQVGSTANLKYGDGRSETSQPPRKRKADDTIPTRSSCPFCSFECFSSGILRSHVNQKHFDKHSKPGSGNGTRKAVGVVVPSTASNSTVTTQRIPNASTQDVWGTVNGERIGAYTQSLQHSKGTSPLLTGKIDVQSRKQITSGVPVATNNLAVISPEPVQPDTTPAPVPRNKHLKTDGMLASPATSLVSNPVINDNQIREPNAAQKADEQLRCRYCNLYFKNSGELHIHVKFHHTNTKGLYMCFTCGYSTKSKPTLMKHIVKWHGRGKVFRCRQTKCKETFSTEEELQRHRHSHEAQRHYVCSLCNAKYKHVTGLRYHQRRHTFNYPYKCQECGLNFKSEGMLKRHEFQKQHIAS
ncbi:uncharacterized protein LOC110986617 [Acanthaster planci]|uniref:Uncharacterized protein LOC110986617 n=1 Tax=Acanthaster planci TaxID=133434 RepID=A0A8B7ZH35_ACAPL|nr:uncharacterized protein LOC110986617 [Acanthaster planci]XP_022104316.1 uncharacterized protein LOC110986617 [Acanthaster planci]XP_022104317.1 uncharacterized protein LOC110986617 [Acanthaster planci]